MVGRGSVPLACGFREWLNSRMGRDAIIRRVQLLMIARNAVNEAIDGALKELEKIDAVAAEQVSSGCDSEPTTEVIVKESNESGLYPRVVINVAENGDDEG